MKSMIALALAGVVAMSTPVLVDAANIMLVNMPLHMERIMV